MLTHEHTLAVLGIRIRVAVLPGLGDLGNAGVIVLRGRILLFRAPKGERQAPEERRE